MNKQHPPKLPLRFFRWYCRPEIVEDIEGDLLEKFYEKARTQGDKPARRFFLWQVLLLLRPGIVRSFKLFRLNQNYMFRHNLLIAWRNAKKDKNTFFINLVGLSAGLVCVLFIYLWVNNELNTDKFLKKDDQLFQVMQNMHHSNGIETVEATPAILANALEEEMSEVEYAITVIPTTFNTSKGVISLQDMEVRSNGQYVSRDFFNVFSYKLLYGNKEEVLSEKNGVVISKELALKLFKSVENAIGKTMDWSSQSINGLCFVTGVFESPPSSATQQFDLLLNYEWFKEVHASNGWGNSSPHTYLQLKKGILVNQFNNKIKDYIKSKDSRSEATLFLQKYSDQYLHGKYENGKPTGGRIEYVRLFVLIAFFILVIACINFMNLSTAKASGRLKEIGIKKAVGADRKTILFQYLQESVLMAFLSLFIAFLLVLLLLPYFNQITGKQLVFNFGTLFILSVLMITLVAGLLAGSYPAIYLSGFKPVDVLKGKLRNSIGNVWARKGLVIFQFTISVILIVSVLVVGKQIEFVQTKNLGYDRDHVIYFRVDNLNDAFLSELKRIPGVVNVGGGNLEAGSPLGGTTGLEWEGKNPEDNTFFSIKWVSYDLIETLSMEMVSGRAFSKEFGSPDQIIFNEEAIESMGLKDPVGKIIRVEGEERQIVGVVKDFHFESLYEEVKPCALLVAPMEYAPKISIKIRAGTRKTTVDNIQKVYQAHYPGLVFDYQFMDDDYQQLYASERRVSTLSRYFASLAILISCLGLLGLATHTAHQRIKEIGIRKVLGASVASVVTLLSKDFLKLVLIAVLLALPIAWFVLTQWLEDFAYQITLEWWIFAAAGMAAIIIAILTVSGQSIKAALTNPVESIRNE